MNSLPPELILELYKYLDPKSALQFRCTNRRCNKVYTGNRSVIPKYEFHLGIVFYDDEIQIACDWIRSYAFTLKRKRRLRSVTSLDFDFRKYKPGVDHVLSTINPIRDFENVISNIGVYANFRSIRIMARLNDEALNSLLKCIPSMPLEQLVIQSCKLNFTDTSMWSSFLARTRPHTIRFCGCVVKCRTLFTQEIVFDVLTKTKSIHFDGPNKFEYAVSDAGAPIIFQSNIITKIKAEMRRPLFKAAVLLKKIENWISGKHELVKLVVSFDPEERANITNYITAIAKDCIEIRANVKGWMLKNVHDEVKMVTITGFEKNILRVENVDICVGHI